MYLLADTADFSLGKIRIAIKEENSLKKIKMCVIK